ncbi:TIGR01906 family membrane protein [Streptococcus pacificus]|uniref:TIGR01906 family membrane protein n=1 Tax=Streptococcus pacificus TaxID=2740577 RepID=A0ABS0ZHE2_9STRE|nr:TIGR01906 family membrane protein [Streptococcus pacificus]MBJ8325421.1 TIGR01906 family membrane protein [Streptococcus pacificus]
MKNKILSLFSIIWLLSLAILVTIYLVWLSYPLAIDYFSLGDIVALPVKRIANNFNDLMFFLTNPLKLELLMPDFPTSESGLKHFFDVKWLFHLAQAVAIVLALPSLSFFKEAFKKQRLWYYQRYYLFALILPVLVAGFAFFIGFDNFFTLFHTLLFPGDSSWLFNPQTDPVILILPEEFFLACFIVFFILYEAIMCLFYLMARRSLFNKLSKRSKN